MEKILKLINSCDSLNKDGAMKLKSMIQASIVVISTIFQLRNTMLTCKEKSYIKQLNPLKNIYIYVYK